MKGQVAYEYLSLLAIAILLITPMVFFAINTSASHRAVTDGETAVSRLASAAKSVYAQGVGAKQTASVFLPQRSELDQSSISDQIIHLRVRLGNGAPHDITEAVDFNVTGSFPDSAGFQEMEVETLENGTVWIR